MPTRAGGGRRAKDQHVCPLAAGDEGDWTVRSAARMWTLVEKEKKKNEAVVAEQAAGIEQ